MNKHYKGCVHWRSADRRNPKEKFLFKFNDWCCKKGAPVDIGYCKTHNLKQLKTKE